MNSVLCRPPFGSRTPELSLSGLGHLDVKVFLTDPVSIRLDEKYPGRGLKIYFRGLRSGLWLDHSVQCGLNCLLQVSVVQKDDELYEPSSLGTLSTKPWSSSEPEAFWKFNSCICGPAPSQRCDKADPFQRLLQMQPSFPRPQTMHQSYILCTPVP